MLASQEQNINPPRPPLQNLTCLFTSCVLNCSHCLLPQLRHCRPILFPMFCRCCYINLSLLTKQLGCSCYNILCCIRTLKPLLVCRRNVGMPNSRGGVIGTAVKSELSRKANPKLLLCVHHEQKRSGAVIFVNSLVKIYRLVRS